MARRFHTTFWNSALNQSNELENPYINNHFGQTRSGAAVYSRFQKRVLSGIASNNNEL